MVHYVQVSESVLLILLVFVACSQSKRLPTLWQDEHSEIKFYRLLTELEVHDSGKSFILEEWASISKQAFRLDTIESPDGIRNTLLVDKSTNEIFTYKPFNCSLVQDLKGAINPHLANRFPSLETFIPTGVGALWLHSILIEANYNGPNDVRMPKPLFSAQRYSKYTVPTTKEFPYRIEFYFSGGGAENIRTLTAIKLLHPTEDKVVMRIRILEQDTLMSLGDDGSDIFDLPPGYGCERRAKFEGASPQPIHAVDTESGPLLMQLDIVSLQPISLAYDHEKWRAHSTSIRLLTGLLELGENDTHSYLVLETQDYAAESNSPRYSRTQQRKATLRHIRRIWDLGHGNQSSQQRIYYEIDEQTGQCLGYGESEPEAQLGFDLNVSGGQSPGSYLDGRDSPLTGFTLNTEIIQELFTGTEGYHLIQSSDSRSKESVYERRINNFRVSDRKGKVSWSGPVSVVRRSLLKETSLSRQRKRFTTVAIHFLSKELDRVEGKLQLEVVEKRYIDQAYFHRELNVAECFAQVKAAGEKEQSRLLVNSARYSQMGEEFFVAYPVESHVAHSLSESNHFEALIYEKFLRSIRQASASQLDALQLVGLGVGFQPDAVQVWGRLIEKPSVLSYQQLRGRKFSNSRRASLFTEFKLDEESCAQSCDLYQCSMFVYCPSAKVCDLQLSQQSETPMTFEPEPTCSLYRPRSAQSEQRKPPMSPGELTGRLRHLVMDQIDPPDPTEDPQALVMSLQYRDDSGEMQDLRLVPDSFESGQFSAQENELIYETPASKSTGAPPREMSSGRLLSSGNLLRAEYELAFDGQRYRSSEEHRELFPLSEAKHLSYEQCGQLCEEIDCRSFSYCAMDGTCDVSGLHRSDQMQAHVERREFCVVMARDYLSKFQRTVQVHRPLVRVASGRQLLEAGSSRDCAISCMEEADFKCRSFYHCPSQADAEGPKTGACYLRKSHSLAELEDTTSGGRAANLEGICDFYSRSYLADFDRFHARRLPTGSEHLSVGFKGLGAEGCASECVHRHPSCPAFQVCRLDGEVHCTVQTSGSEENVPERLTVAEGCTAFLTTNSSGATQVQTADPSRRRSQLERQDPQRNWLIRGGLLLGGLILGYFVDLTLRRRAQ